MCWLHKQISLPHLLRRNFQPEGWSLSEHTPIESELHVINVSNFGLVTQPLLLKATECARLTIPTRMNGFKLLTDLSLISTINLPPIESRRDFPPFHHEFCDAFNYTFCFLYCMRRGLLKIVHIKLLLRANT